MEREGVPGGIVAGVEVPLDIWALVFAALPWPQSARDLSAVCRLFAALARSAPLWTRLDFAFAGYFNSLYIIIIMSLFCCYLLDLCPLSEGADWRTTARARARSHFPLQPLLIVLCYLL